MNELTQDDVDRFRRDGYVCPLPALSGPRAAELRGAALEHLTGKTDAARFELTDDIQVRNSKPADQQPEFVYVDEPPEPELRELPFLFNLWKVDPRFERVANDPQLVGYAQRLLGVDEVLLMEDNIVTKLPDAKAVPWHQDYSYWPLGEPSAVTIWIALDDITPENGGMQISPGTQDEGERLPVRFMDGSSFMEEERPDVAAVPNDPGALGFPVHHYNLKAGQCGIHDALVWHGSTPNLGANLRCALVLRYVAVGTTWLGDARIPYDDIGCEIGAPLGEEHFPLAGGRL